MMFITRRTKHPQLKVFLPILFVLMTCVLDTRGQQPGANHPSMRDQVRAIQRAEMDRLLLFSAARTESNSNRVALMKQIKEDFRDLQGLNNKMMAEAWARESLDYSVISEMVSRIRGKATRLKLNLNLPQPDNVEKRAPVHNVATAREFRNALLVLDQTIMRFVKNPLFQSPNTIELNQAGKARQDLEEVISLTADLKRTASRLGKASSSSH
jgi:hypothetical protein